MKICKQCETQVESNSLSCPVCGCSEFLYRSDTEPEDPAVAVVSDDIILPEEPLPEVEITIDDVPGSEQVPEMDAIFCTHCGKPNKATAAFCRFCGQRIGMPGTVQTPPDRGQVGMGGRSPMSPTGAGPMPPSGPGPMPPAGQPYGNGAPTKKSSSGGKIAIIIIAIVLALAVIVAVAVLLFNRPINRDKDPETTPKETMRETTAETETIEEIEDTEDTEPVPETVEQPMTEPPVEAYDKLDVSAVKSTLNGLSADHMAYVIDLDHMEEYDISSGEASAKASALMLVPIMYTVAYGYDSGQLTDSNLVEFHYSTAGRTQSSARSNGELYTLKEILAEALRYSDNNAINSLIDYLSMDSINSVCHEYGYNSVQIARKIGQDNGKENYISAKDACKMLADIYNGRFKGGIDGSFLRSYMRISDDGSKYGMTPVCRGLDTYLNLNAVIFENPNLYNEIAIVSQNGKTVILCALTNYGSYDQSQAAVGRFAQEVVDELLY